MKKNWVRLLLFLLLFNFSGSVYAGPKEENRTPYFSFTVDLEGDQNDSLGVLLDAVKPGDVYEGTVTLVNPEDINAEYSLDMSNGVVGSNGQYVFAGASNSSGLGNWLEFEKTEFSLSGAGSKEVVPFTIKVPENAEPGDYVAGITMQLEDYDDKIEVKQEEVKGGSGSQAVATTAMGTTMIFHVLGDINYEVMMDAADWSLEIGRGYFVNVKLTNKGNVAVRPLLNVVVSDNSDKELYNKDFLYLAPLYSGVSNEQTFQLSDLKELPYGRYHVSVSAYYMGEFQYFTFANSGKELTRNDMQPSGTATFSLWILPLTVIYIVVGVLLFLIIVYIFWNYYRRRNQGE